MRKKLRQTLCCLLLCAMLMPCLTVGASAGDFIDVPEGHWAAASIKRCTDLGFFKGETATVFGVGKEINRAAFIVVLSRFFGWETPAVKESSYTDVPADAWYAGAVEAALRNGAITKQTDLFRPTDPLTREELAVILIRALGYTSLAGLVQDLPSTFEDVTTNPGYIALSRELGLVTGVTATSFAPDRAATRETVAVILMRLYDKLHAAASEKIGVVYSTEGLPDLTGFAAVAVNGGTLLYKEGKARLTAASLTAEEVTLIRDAAAQAGAGQLLYVSGTNHFLRGKAEETVVTLGEAVENGGYDGLYLDVHDLSAQYKRDLTQMVSALRSTLGKKLLYVAVEAPSWHGRNDLGYDYVALSQQTDRLVLRIAAYDKKVSNIPMAPVEPLEEVYYAFARLNDQMDMAKVSLQLTTTVDVWKGSKKTESCPGAEVEKLRTMDELAAHYAERYACAYLTGAVEKQTVTAWYLNETATLERLQMAACFGVRGICLSRLDGTTGEVLAALR